MNEDFFNERAKTWRATRRTDMAKIGSLLRLADIGTDMRVLDAGCGDGILSPMLSGLVGKKGSVVGVDAACAMIQEAQALHPQLHNVTYRMADIETMPFVERFDRIVMLNVFPHLAHPVKSVKRLLTEALKPDGLLLIAHDTGRGVINHIHRSNGLGDKSLLPSAKEVARSFEDESITVLDLADNDSCYYLLLAPLTIGQAVAYSE